MEHREARIIPHRASHRKSHNGCSICKRKHIKCDERLPQCTACIRYGLRCSYLDRAPLALLTGHKRSVLPIRSGGGHSRQAKVTAKGTTRGVDSASRDLAKRLRCCEPAECSTICTQIGGYCNDPFNTFPVESRPYIASAYGYFATVYMPSAFRMLNIAADIPFFYSGILHDAMQFDALIAMVLTLQRVHLDRSARISYAIQYHSGRATKALRERLLSGKDITSDAVFCTMFRLLIVQHLLGNFEALEIHVNGLKQLVKLCGGIDNLRGLRGFVKSTTIKTFAAWHGIERTRGKDLQNTVVKQELTYPEHPFSADLCLKFTAFPDGFRELALSGKLSLQSIHYVHLIVQLSLQNGHEKPTHLSLLSDDVLGKPGITTLERLLASALFAYNILVCSERQVASLNPADSMYIDQQVERSVSSPDLDSCGQDFMDWTCLMLRATTQKDTRSWRWANARLQSRIVSDDRLKELGNAFIPIP